MNTRRLSVPVVLGLLAAAPAVVSADEIDNFPTTSGLFTLTTSSLTEVVALSGSMQQVVQVGINGEATDSNANGLDDVTAEVTALSLSGTSSLGTVQLMLDTSRVSSGSIEETINATPGILDVPPFQPTGAANEEFGIFLTMQIGGGPILTSVGSAQVSQFMNHKPPSNFNDLWNDISTVDFLEGGRPVGVSLGRCSPEPGITCPAVPEPNTLVLLASGSAAFGAARAARARTTGRCRRCS